MTVSSRLPSLEQIRQNIMEDAREYQDKRIEELTDQLGAAYSRTFMHVAMIAHWATFFREPVSMMLTNFRSTPSIAVPASVAAAPANCQLKLELKPAPI